MVPVSLHQLLMAAILLFASLPRVATRSLLASLPSLTSLDHMTASSPFSSSPSASKRQGADVWSLCPETLPMRECFDRYLTIYARLRNQANSRDSITIRNIGKRTSNHVAAAKPAFHLRDLCPPSMTIVQCANFLVSILMESFDVQVKQDLTHGAQF